jgi:PAS domain S-box-containing protein
MKGESEPRDRYRRLVELSPDGILISQDNRLVFLNPAALRLFGASSPEQVLGRSPFDVFHPESHALIRERIRQMMAGQSVPPAEEKIVRLDGVVTDVEVNSTRLDEPASEAIQVIVRDISGRKRAESILRQNEERLTLAFAGAQEGGGTGASRPARSCTRRDGRRCSVTPRAKSNRTSAPGSICCIPTTSPAPTS